MHPLSLPARRQWLCWALTGTLVLSGCTTPPPATTPTARAAALERLGFQRTDDGWEFSITGKILFETASDALDADSLATVVRIGDALVRLDIAHLRIEGHTDNVGAAPFNRALYLNRAEAVAQALASRGLPRAGMDVRGLGKDRPVLDNSTPEGRMQNRRVAVIVPAQ